jgi:hypothetical protein
MELLIMKFSPHPCYLVPLRPKCSPHDNKQLQKNISRLYGNI